jgi:hypothetical protein
MEHLADIAQNKQSLGHYFQATQLQAAFKTSRSIGKPREFGAVGLEADFERWSKGVLESLGDPWTRPNGSSWYGRCFRHFTTEGSDDGAVVFPFQSDRVEKL